MCTNRILQLLKSFEESYDPSREYKITLKNTEIVIGKIDSFNRAAPGELFHDPETGLNYDANENTIVNIFVFPKDDSNLKKINFREILDIKFLDSQ